MGAEDVGQEEGEGEGGGGGGVSVIFYLTTRIFVENCTGLMNATTYLYCTIPTTLAPRRSPCSATASSFRRKQENG